MVSDPDRRSADPPLAAPFSSPEAGPPPTNPLGPRSTCAGTHMGLLSMTAPGPAALLARGARVRRGPGGKKIAPGPHNSIEGRRGFCYRHTFK